MTEQTQTGATALDTVKLAAAAAIVIGGIAAFYWFGDLPAAVRWLIVLAALGLGALVAQQSAQGRAFWQFVQGSRVELRKVVWPTIKETRAMTLVVFAAVVVMGVFFWVLDLILGSVTHALTGQGG
jgi:preprotein translocase subunit SecE